MLTQPFTPSMTSNRVQRRQPHFSGTDAPANTPVLPRPTEKPQTPDIAIRALFVRFFSGILRKIANWWQRWLDKIRIYVNRSASLSRKRLQDQKGAKLLHFERFLALMAKNGWIFATRPNAEGTVTVLPLVHTPTQVYFVFLKTRRPPLHTKTMIEPVAGLRGDMPFPETAEQTAIRELDEELGLQEEVSRPLIRPPEKLFTHAIASSPGITDEESEFYLVEQFLADPEVDKVKAHKARGDGDIIQGQCWIPVQDFLKDPLGTLEKVTSENGIPSNDMLSGLSLLLGHLCKTGRLKMTWSG